MRSWQHLRFLYAVAALLMLCLVSAGCSKGGDQDAAPVEGGAPAGDPGMPVGDPGMPGGDPGMPGGDPMMGDPAMGGMPGEGGGGGGAAGALPQEPAITFQEMLARPQVKSQPKPVVVKQPDGSVVRYIQFQYFVKGDPEALLPFIVPPTNTSPDTGSTWMVFMPDEWKKGTRTPGDWENLFCTYVVPDKAAIQNAMRALETRMAQLRKRIYNKPYHTVEVLAGDTVPPAAQAQADDAVAAATEASFQRAMQYLRSADKAASAGRMDQAKLFVTAGLTALGDEFYANGREADALWIYQETSRQIR